MIVAYGAFCRRVPEYRKLFLWAGHPVFISFVFAHVGAAVCVAIPAFTFKNDKSRSVY